VTTVDVEHTLTPKEVLHMFSKCYVKAAHSHCVNVVAIHKMASMQGDNLGTVVHYANSVWMQLIVMKYFEDPQLG
jgi:hypothetical protein